MTDTYRLREGYYAYGRKAYWGSMNIPLEPDECLGLEKALIKHADGWEEPPDPPVANFSSDVVTGEAPLVVTFTDTSTNSPTVWEWDFGDGGTATDQNPQHTYVEAGTFTVTLTCSNAGGIGSIVKAALIIVTDLI